MAENKSSTPPVPPPVGGKDGDDDAPAFKGAKFIWLINNEERARTLALKPLPQPGSKTFAVPQMMTVLPGATCVDREFWEKWKSEDKKEARRLLTEKIPADRHRQRRAERAGLPYFVEGPHVVSRERPFEGLNEAEALNLVPEIREEGALRFIAQIERRPAVLEAIRKELLELVRGMAQPAAV